MSFFKKLPNVSLDIYGNGNKHKVTDLFRSSDLTDAKIDDLSSYIEYVIQDGERPDVVSQKLYNDPKYHWTFFIINDWLKEGMVRWPLGDHQLDKHMGQIFDEFGVIRLNPNIESINGVVEFNNRVTGIDLEYDNVRIKDNNGYLYPIAVYHTEMQEIGLLKGCVGKFVITGLDDLDDKVKTFDLPPKIVVTSDSGSNATGECILDGNGVITEVRMMNNGGGYTRKPKCVVNIEPDLEAELLITTDNLGTPVAAIVNSGLGYKKSPTLYVTPASGGVYETSITFDLNSVDGSLVSSDNGSSTFADYQDLIVDGINYQNDLSYHTAINVDKFTLNGIHSFVNNIPYDVVDQGSLGDGQAISRYNDKWFAIPIDSSLFGREIRWEDLSLYPQLNESGYGWVIGRSTSERYRYNYDVNSIDSIDIVAPSPSFIRGNFVKDILVNGRYSFKNPGQTQVIQWTGSNWELRDYDDDEIYATSPSIGLSPVVPDGVSLIPALTWLTTNNDEFTLIPNGSPLTYEWTNDIDKIFLPYDEIYSYSKDDTEHPLEAENWEILTPNFYDYLDRFGNTIENVARINVNSTYNGIYKMIVAEDVQEEPDLVVNTPVWISEEFYNKAKEYDAGTTLGEVANDNILIAVNSAYIQYNIVNEGSGDIYPWTLGLPYILTENNRTFSVFWDYFARTPDIPAEDWEYTGDSPDVLLGYPRPGDYEWIARDTVSDLDFEEVENTSVNNLTISNLFGTNSQNLQYDIMSTTELKCVAEIIELDNLKVNSKIENIETFSIELLNPHLHGTEDYEKVETENNIWISSYIEWMKETRPKNYQDLYDDYDSDLEIMQNLKFGIGADEFQDWKWQNGVNAHYDESKQSYAEFLYKLNDSKKSIKAIRPEHIQKFVRAYNRNINA